MVRFIYAGDNYNRDRELVAINLCNITSTLIELPSDIEIEFKQLENSVYGETILDPRFKNRLRLNDTLSPKEIIKPLVHELLHLNQTHLGRLSAGRDGTYIWDNKPYRAIQSLTVEQWAALPWEIDVANKQHLLLEQILKAR